MYLVIHERYGSQVVRAPTSTSILLCDNQEVVISNKESGTRVTKVNQKYLVALRFESCRQSEYKITVTNKDGDINDIYCDQLHIPTIKFEYGNDSVTVGIYAHELDLEPIIIPRVSNIEVGESVRGVYYGPKYEGCTMKTKDAFLGRQQVVWEDINKEVRAKYTRAVVCK